MDFSVSADREAIRTAVPELCAQVPDAYWRELDREQAYPHAFVRVLVESGWLAVLIPPEFGGTGLGIADFAVVPEEINRSGGNAASADATVVPVNNNLVLAYLGQKVLEMPRSY